MSTKADLMQIADSFGIQVPAKATKEQIQTLINDRMKALDHETVVDNPEPEPVDNQEVEPVTLPAEVVEEVGEALALREQSVVATHALPSAQEYAVLGTLANRVYQTTFVPVAYRNREADVFAAFLFGREIGLGPMMSLRDIHMIDGRPALAAHRQLALLRSSGVKILESESTDERAWIKAQRADTGEVMAVEYTMEAARKIMQKGKPLTSKDNWKNYPSDMLWARAVGRLTRRLGSDLTGGLPTMTAEEVADLEGYDVSVGDAGFTYTRQEKPPWNAPGSWAELNERLTLALGEDETVEWRQEIVSNLYGHERVADMDKEEKDDLWASLVPSLHDLEELGDLTFDVDHREHVQEVFAKHFDGSILEGPEWRLSPKETERPLKQATDEPEAESAEEVEGEVVEPVDNPVEETEPVESTDADDSIDFPYNP